MGIFPTAIGYDKKKLFSTLKLVSSFFEGSSASFAAANNYFYQLLGGCSVATFDSFFTIVGVNQYRKSNYYSYIEIHHEKEQNYLRLTPVSSLMVPSHYLYTPYLTIRASHLPDTCLSFSELFHQGGL
mgnify:CR=1 FL=1